MGFDITKTNIVHNGRYVMLWASFYSMVVIIWICHCHLLLALSGMNWVLGTTCVYSRMVLILDFGEQEIMMPRSRIELTFSSL